MSACRPTAPIASGAGQAGAAGFTLLELMLALIVMSLFFGTVYETVIIALRAANAVDEREQIRQQLAHTLELLTREAAVASNVDNAEDQRFQMDGDVDGDGDDESNINYRVQDGDLQRVHSGEAVTLIPDVSALDFDYVDLNGNAMTAPVTPGSSRDNIRVIQIAVTAVRDHETISVASAAYLRNNR